VPGLYPGRTRHIHVKAQAPRRPVLTTQLYFRGERANAGDGIFLPELLVRGLRKANGRWSASFDFVLEV
jgi:protocatechuate 3,4-dioxygenase beta subunit